MDDLKFTSDNIWPFHIIQRYFQHMRVLKIQVGQTVYDGEIVLSMDDERELTIKVKPKLRGRPRKQK